VLVMVRRTRQSTRTFDIGTSDGSDASASRRVFVLMH